MGGPEYKQFGDEFSFVAENSTRENLSTCEFPPGTTEASFYDGGGGDNHAGTGTRGFFCEVVGKGRRGRDTSNLARDVERNRASRRRAVKIEHVKLSEWA